jgi:hypothetical protein
LIELLLDIVAHTWYAISHGRLAELTRALMSLLIARAVMFVYESVLSEETLDVAHAAVASRIPDVASMCIHNVKDSDDRQTIAAGFAL